MSDTSKNYKTFNVDLSSNHKSIAMTNIYEKTDGTYKNLPLGSALLSYDVLSFADFVEMVLCTKTELYPHADRIDFTIDEGVINKYELPFDSFTVSLYREGFELNKGYSSNYSYTEFNNHRNLWVDLYYSYEDYDSELVFKDIIREINNFMNRDFEKYLNE